MVFPGLLHAAPAAAAASAGLLLLHVADDGRQVRQLVPQRDGDLFLFPDLVRHPDPGDPLRDRRPKLRQRYPAFPVQGQPVQAFAGLLAQLQPADGHCHLRVAVSLQPLPGPGPQRALRLGSAEGLDLRHHAVDVLVLADVVPADVQVVLADRVKPRIHPAAVDHPLQGLQVPPGPHLAGGVVRDPPDVDPEGDPAQVVFPAGVRAAVRHGLQRREKGVPVELVGPGDVVKVKVAQRPQALPRQDVLGRGSRAAGACAGSGDVLVGVLSKKHRVLQRADDVLQRELPGVRVEGHVRGSRPPHDSFPGPRFVVQQPAAHRDLRILRPQLQGGCAFSLFKAQPQRLRHQLPLRRQALPAQ